jgi:signal transduction histidine kinase/DNA-binding response OmpR family regulator/ligand-binding sensor domain-containing protein
MFRHHLLPKLLFPILLAVPGMSIWAQPKYEWLTTSNGLSQGYIYDMIQDKDGFMWFSTKAGLNRYDGYSFKIFAHDAYNPNSISSNVVNKLFEDSKGRLWIGTGDNGVNVYDKITGIFRRIVNDPGNPNSLSGNRISSNIIELTDGRFLVYASQKSFNLISLPENYFQTNAPPSIVHIAAPFAENDLTLCKDAKGRVWMTNKGKLYRFIPETPAFEWRKDNFSFDDNYVTNADGSIWTNGDKFNLLELDDTCAWYPLFTKSVTKSQGSTFCRDEEKDKIWIGIMNINQLLVYDTKKWKKGSPLDPDATLVFKDTAVNPTKMLKDRAGNLWMGTSGYGIRKYTFESEKFKHLAKGQSVRKIQGYNQNEIFLNGWGFTKRITSNGELLPYIPDRLKYVVHDFLISKSGDFWVLNRKSSAAGPFVVTAIERYNPVTGARKTFPVSLKIDYGGLEPIIEDKSGNIWVCGIDGQVIVINPVTNSIHDFNVNTDASQPMLPNAFITSMYQDGKGIFWMGAENGFVKLEYDNTTEAQPKITWYRSKSTDKNSLNFNHVSCFLDDPADDNLLWISTKGGGLNLLDKTTGKFTHITTQDGLCNNVVYGILADEGGNIWGSTNNGIFCLLNKRKDEHGSWLFRHFTKASGLQDDEFNTGAYAKLPNGDLAFGGINGLSVFNPATVLKSEFTPNVFITNILVGNEPVLPNDKSGVLKQAIEHSPSITLDYSQDILTLEFSSLDFTAPNQNKYRYQLVGIDKGWVESGSRRTATYLHLPPGSYTFKVQGSDSEGTWSSNIAELKIMVNPPWWRTWWAYLAYILAGILIIRSYFRFSVNRAKLKSQLSFEQNEAKRAKELDTLKTQLYTNITHEFRTPLTVILGMAHQIVNKPDEHLQSGTQMIIRNGESLLKLVNEMLDLSKLESGKMSLQLVQGDVINFLRYIVESFHSLAESQQKQLHFLSEIDSLNIAYDPEKMRQIVGNLLSNALKFTPEKGNIYISVNENMTDAKGQSLLVIKVKDTGIGIPENQMPYIFDRFYQSDNSDTRKTEGTGIGLALTKELVKLMEGEITVKSPPTGSNKGSEFTVALPLKKVAMIETGTTHPDPAIDRLRIIPSQKVNATQEIKSEPIEEVAGNERPLILLVEDNADVVAYTASCLPDYRLAVGKDGAEGLEIATDTIPDLIITDVMMPVMDGFELCQKLRKDERTSHIPIIMLTAKADMASKMEGLERGADVYLHKPFNREELLIRIKKLLELRTTLQQYYLKQSGLTDKTVSVPVPADNKTEDAFVKKVREMIEAHLSDLDFTVEQLCKIIFMSHSQLHRKLEALTGCSPNKFIRIIRLNKAKELLKDPGNSIASIALDCGYNDPSYFSRVFKQENNVTPQEWRINAKVVS